MKKPLTKTTNATISSCDNDNDAYWELSDQDIQELRDFLQNQCVPAGGMNLANVDGLITARITADERIFSPSWFPLVYGMDEKEAKERLFADQNAWRRIENLLWNRFDHIYDTLKEDCFQSTFHRASTIESGTDPETYKDSWCIGYLHDIAFRQNEWRSLFPVVKDQTLTPMCAEAVEFLTPFIMDEYHIISDDNTRSHPLWSKITEILPKVAQEIFTTWCSYQRKISSIPHLPLPHKAPKKIGRNEPCPCGSQKKYKKCCGSA